MKTLYRGKIFYAFLVGFVHWIDVSIFLTSSLGFKSRATAIFHIVEKFACFVPLSIIDRCVLAIPAKPLRTSWDRFFSLRSERIV